ncbi:MAG: hypothetical protein OXB95_14425 [Rhodobacteraceae bacterium]|nr:hypothetical protein [Paracoccaceae bacterium]
MRKPTVAAIAILQFFVWSLPGAALGDARQLYEKFRQSWESLGLEVETGREVFRSGVVEIWDFVISDPQDEMRVTIQSIEMWDRTDGRVQVRIPRISLDQRIAGTEGSRTTFLLGQHDLWLTELDRGVAADFRSDEVSAIIDGHGLTGEVNVENVRSGMTVEFAHDDAEGLHVEFAADQINSSFADSTYADAGCIYESSHLGGSIEMEARWRMDDNSVDEVEWRLREGRSTIDYEVDCAFEQFSIGLAMASSETSGSFKLPGGGDLNLELSQLELTADSSDMTERFGAMFPASVSRLTLDLNAVESPSEQSTDIRFQVQEIQLRDDYMDWLDEAGAVESKNIEILLAANAWYLDDDQWIVSINDFDLEILDFVLGARGTLRGLPGGSEAGIEIGHFVVEIRNLRKMADVLVRRGLLPDIVKTLIDLQLTKYAPSDSLAGDAFQFIVELRESGELFINERRLDAVEPLLRGWQNGSAAQTTAFR